MFFFWETWAWPFLALQVALTIWMLVDAHQRGVEPFWFWIILIFQPFGAWVYFFAVKWRTFRWSSQGFASLLPERKMSMEELRYHVQQAPTTANRMALAERLMDQGGYDEAIPLLEAVVAFESNYCPALFALAQCRMSCNQPDAALVHLQKTLDKDPRWSNYRAWPLLLETYEALGQDDQALQACRQYAKYLPTLENKCLLAEHLLAGGFRLEAIKVLHDALEENRFARFQTRWRNRRWAAQAQTLLAEADKDLAE